MYFLSLLFDFINGRLSELFKAYVFSFVLTIATECTGHRVVHLPSSILKVFYINNDSDMNLCPQALNPAFYNSCATLIKRG